MIASLTSKGQITLPKAIRDQLNLKAGDKVDFFVSREGHLEGVVKKESPLKLKGMLPKPSYPVSVADMNDAVAEGSSLGEGD